ncbi:MAG: hypothetical protein FGM52_01125 [Mycobacterium sp.]|nr:hypothetical protein [Mycobacterium sp.]
MIAAAVTDPFQMGIYAWGFLAVSFIGSFSDYPMRICALQLTASTEGRRFLRRQTVVIGTASFAVLVCALCAIPTITGAESQFKTFCSLAPMLAVPVAWSASILPTIMLQIGGEWGRVSLARAISAIVGSGVGIPIVLATRSIIGPCTAVAIAELVYVLLIRRSRPREEESLQFCPDSAHAKEVAEFWPTYRHMALYASFGWLQGSADRWLIGLWAGTGALGIYSLGSAIGRSLGEVVAISQEGVVRVDLHARQARSDELIKQVLGRHLRATLLLSLATGVATIVFAELVFAPILGPQWNVALQLVPIFVLSTLPLAIACQSGPVHVQRGRSRIAAIAPGVCIAFAPLVGLAATHSLIAATWVYLIRECFFAGIQVSLLGRARPWLEVAAAAGIVTAGAAVLLSTGW